MVHVYGGAYMIFSVNNMKLPRSLALWINTLNCACYGMTIALLSVHFIYRYLAVCRPNRMVWFRWPYYSVWFFFCLEIFLEWWLTTVVCCTENENIDLIVRDSMEYSYNLSRDNYIYAGLLYYKLDENGNQTISWFAILVTVNVLKMMTICMSIVLFCGISTFRKLTALEYTSKLTFSLQKQLFKALVAQTLIPMITMFIPAGLMMFAPLFLITLGSVESVIMTTITTYPFLDPLVVIFFVRDYRNFIWQTIRCRTKVVQRKSNSIRVTTFATE